MTNWYAREKGIGPNPGVAKYPHLPAYLTKDGLSLRVWCCWCHDWHYHGAGTIANGDFPAYGGRIAHCHTDSPYRRTGYYLTDPEQLARKGWKR